MRCRRFIAAIVLGVSVGSVAPSLVAPSLAHADPTASERETARTLLLSGRDKKKNGQLKEALADFEKAHGIMRVPTTGLDLGKVQKELGLLVEARATLLEAARYPEKSNEPGAFKKARKEAKQLADEIAPKLATLTLTVSKGANVKMDDAELTSSSVGVPLKVNPGKHEIVASLNGDQKKANVDLSEGESKSIELMLAGTAVEPAREEEKKDTAGSKKKMQTETRTNSLVYVGAATAVVGFGVGAATGIMAFGVKNDVASRCDDGTKCPPSTYSDIDNGVTLTTVSTVGFIVGLIGGGILIYGLLNPSQIEVPASSSAKAKTKVMFSPFGLNGSF